MSDVFYNRQCFGSYYKLKPTNDNQNILDMFNENIDVNYTTIMNKSNFNIGGINIAKKDKFIIKDTIEETSILVGKIFLSSANLNHEEVFLFVNFVLTF